MKIAIVGAPSCRKSTTAEAVNVRLKQEGKNSTICPEVARTYIGRYGPIHEPWEQMLIFHDQVRLESELCLCHPIVICDSATWLGYIYFNLLAKKTDNNYKIRKLRQELHTMILNSIDYDHTFFMPIAEPVIKDGIRVQNDDERKIIQDMILGFMHVEGIPYKTVVGTVEQKAGAILDYIGYTNPKVMNYPSLSLEEVGYGGD